MNVNMKSLATPLVEKAYIKWLKQEGERVKEGEILAEVETSKVLSSIKAPCDGILTHILCEDNAYVNVHDDVAIIE